MNKQRGGTLLGLIIGALIGLGIALAVAVYVTKVPVPFMNKSPTHSPDSDAAEEKKNKDWNPNTPLAGKTPALPVPATPPVASEATTAPALLPPAPAVVTVPSKSATSSGTISVRPEARLNNPPAPAVSSDPLGDLANARANGVSGGVSGGVAGVPTFGATADPFNYFIQAGAYRTPEDAEQQRAKLVLLGLQAKVSEREQSGRTVYRVRLGPFDNKEDAEKAKARLDRNSVETALVRVQR